MKVLGFAGHSGCGKTTLIEQLIPRFTALGLRVSLVKHADDGFDIDRPGKDSYRHREAGATEVMLVSRRRWALQHELRGAAEPTLEQQLARLSRCDLVLVEGFKSSSIPKIEICRRSLGVERLPRATRNVIAIACDAALDGEHAPVLDLNDPDAIAAFVLQVFDLAPRPAFEAALEAAPARIQAAA